jgi:hypothetical protein
MTPRCRVGPEQSLEWRNAACLAPGCGPFEWFVAPVPKERCRHRLAATTEGVPEKTTRMAV